MRERERRDGEAKKLLAMSTTFRLMEVWQGTRKMGIVETGSA
jgi:hypothetical protein